MKQQKLENPMRRIRVEKITINFGAGNDQAKMEKGIKMLKKIFGKTPVKTYAKKRIQGWGIRPGLAIGLKLTFRGKEAIKWLKLLLEAKGNKLKESSFDNEGNFSFGIPEYIDIPGVKYDSSIGILGFEIAVTLERPGFRIKRRRIQRRTIPKRHRITKSEAIEFVKKEFGVEIVAE